MILDYIIQFHLEDCFNILCQSDNLGYYGINIDFLKLFESCPDIGDKVLCNPVQTLPICDDDIVKAQKMIVEKEEYKDQISKLNYCYLKQNVHARFFGLPVCPELHRTVFPKNVDLGCFLKVTGTVVRVTQVKMLEYQRKYVCMKCKYENHVLAQFENRYVLKGPLKCGNEITRCKCTTFSQVNLVSREYCKDYQEIKIQEQVNKLNIGSIPGSMWVVLEDDLVDCCKPGDDVYICGTVRRRWRPVGLNKRLEIEIVLQANYIEVCNAQRTQVISAAPDVKDCFDEYWNKFKACPLKGRDQILSSVCPQVYGLHLVKLALLLTVITGSNHVIENETEKNEQNDKNTSHIRGQCHLLLVGDPGTGKSQLLRAGAELTPRAVFTSGAGSTRAGLTCAALREDGEWQLEAGALVLSDGGVCCIDEISQLREHDRTAIHEAMEQQTISIAKAGIVCKLNTRCAIIAACNPKGHYATDQPLSVNVSLGTPLLSRFDLIFILLDSKNRNWDELVSSYILFGKRSEESKKQWSLEKLQMYISLIGPKFTQMTKSANLILQSYYMLQRKSEYRDPSRTTVRMLDSLFRLSQAHCRLMYRNIILPVDAIMAVSLVDLSMQDCTLKDTEDALHSTFQEYPDFQYLCTAKTLLTKLDLTDIWQDELTHYAKLLQIDCRTLETDIDKHNHNAFIKYNDISDDNIPLSASLITSSYFNIKRNQETDKSKTKQSIGQNTNVNKILAATLKKHANMNKEIKSPEQLKPVKRRRRKEVTVDSNIIPITNKKQRKGNILVIDDDSDNDELDTNKLLNGVPSVNDVFHNLGIELRFDTATSVNCNDNANMVNAKDETYNNTNFKKGENDLRGGDERPIKENSCHQDGNSKVLENNDSNDIKCKLKQFQYANTDDSVNIVNTKDKTNDEILINLENDQNSDNQVKSSINSWQLGDNKKVLNNKHASDIKSKLKQFEYVNNHDLSNFYDICNNSSVTESIAKNLEVNKLKTTKHAGSHSQISMFESSDCEIDLDI